MPCPRSLSYRVGGGVIMMYRVVSFLLRDDQRSEASSVVGSHPGATRTSRYPVASRNELAWQVPHPVRPSLASLGSYHPRPTGPDRSMPAGIGPTVLGNGRLPAAVLRRRCFRPTSFATAFATAYCSNNTRIRRSQWASVLQLVRRQHQQPWHKHQVAVVAMAAYYNSSTTGTIESAASTTTACKFPNHRYPSIRPANAAAATTVPASERCSRSGDGRSGPSPLAAAGGGLVMAATWCALTATGVSLPPALGDDGIRTTQNEGSRRAGDAVVQKEKEEEEEKQKQQQQQQVIAAGENGTPKRVDLKVTSALDTEDEGTLRWAIRRTNEQIDRATIGKTDVSGTGSKTKDDDTDASKCGPNTIEIRLPEAATILLKRPLPELIVRDDSETKAIRILGNGATISGDDRCRVFTVRLRAGGGGGSRGGVDPVSTASAEDGSAVIVSIEDLTIRRGRATGADGDDITGTGGGSGLGGGLLLYADDSSRSRSRGSSTTGGSGTGGCVVRLSNVKFRECSAVGGAGGIVASPPSATLLPATALTATGESFGTRAPSSSSAGDDAPACNNNEPPPTERTSPPDGAVRYAAAIAPAARAVSSTVVESSYRQDAAQEEGQRRGQGSRQQEQHGTNETPSQIPTRKNDVASKEDQPTSSTTLHAGTPQTTISVDGGAPITPTATTGRVQTDKGALAVGGGDDTTQTSESVSSSGRISESIAYDTEKGEIVRVSGTGGGEEDGDNDDEDDDPPDEASRDTESRPRDIIKANRGSVVGVSGIGKNGIGTLVFAGGGGLGGFGNAGNGGNGGNSGAGNGSEAGGGGTAGHGGLGAFFGSAQHVTINFYRDRAFNNGGISTAYRNNGGDPLEISSDRDFLMDGTADDRTKQLGSFSGGSGSGLGGAVCVRGGRLEVLGGVEFVGNKAVGGKGLSTGRGLGGAIFVAEPGKVVFDSKQAPVFARNESSDSTNSMQNNNDLFGSIYTR